MQCDIVEAYRQGLGLAAVTVICSPNEIRIAASERAGDSVLTAVETMQARWWCRRATEAERVATAATARLRRRKASEAAPPALVSLASASVEAAARQLNVVLHPDNEISAEAMTVAARIDSEIDQMQQRGELKSVNKSYRQYRIEAADRGEAVLRYQDWMRRYRADLVRTLAATLRQF